MEINLKNVLYSKTRTIKQNDSRIRSTVSATEENNGYLVFLETDYLDDEAWETETVQWFPDGHKNDAIEYAVNYVI